MYSNVSRREAGGEVVKLLRQWKFRNPSTRKGQPTDVFHVDAENLVGRGSVTATPVPATDLEGIYETVYKNLDRRRIHFARGGYTPESVVFADRHGIALFSFDASYRFTARNGTAKSMQRSAKRQRHKPNGRTLVVGVLALIALSFLAFPQQATWVAIIGAAIVVSWLIGMVQDGRR